MSPRFPRLPRSRRWQLLLGAVVIVAIAAAITAVSVLNGEGDISNGAVEFTTQPTDPEPPPSPTEPTKRRPAHERFIWPVYGFTNDRRRYLSGPSLAPPYRHQWTLKARALLEFSPVIGGKWLYLLDDAGYVRSIRKKTGHVRWKRRLGVLAAASPAYTRGRIYVVILSRAKGKPGRVAALHTKTGKVAWQRDLPARAESSPVLDRGTLYFGTEDGSVYALNTKTGRTRWRFRAAGPVKGGLALDEGRLYFGDYSGAAYAIRQSTGRLIWRAKTRGARLGLASGQFYSTPAVAFGRVYLGNTDSNVYSFSARTGRLAWRTKTGHYVYGSPAVAQVPGAKPTVYVGSYDGNFYAFDARSGRKLWHYRDGGTISGGASIIGNIVYFSNNRLKTTTGLNARSGRRVFRFGHGAYNPVVSDRDQIFLTGSSSLYAFRPRNSS